jgi:H2-forming N5,N10-methylenetetrahydromethanopterin dehydrogenase-like enzyme
MRVESGMAENKKAPITLALENDGSPYSLHHDLAGHFRMDRAVVGIRSCLPTGTVIACGPKTKLSIFAATSAAKGWSVAVTRDDPANSSSAIIIGLITTAIHTFFFVNCLFPFLV